MGSGKPNSGQFEKGQQPWNKGKKTGLIPWNKGKPSPMKGKHRTFTEEWKRNLSKGHKGKKLSEESELHEKKIESDKLKEISIQNISEIKKQIDKTIKQDDQTHLIIEFYDDLKVTDLRSIVDYAKKSFKNEGVVVIGAKNNNKISYLIGVSDQLSNNIGANEIAQFAASISNGKGGGGRKDFAQSGGELINEDDQIDQIKSFIISKL